MASMDVVLSTLADMRRGADAESNDASGMYNPAEGLGDPDGGSSEPLLVLRYMTYHQVCLPWCTRKAPDFPERSELWHKTLRRPL